MREMKLQLSSVQEGYLLTHRIQERVEKIHHKQRADKQLNFKKKWI